MWDVNTRFPSFSDETVRNGWVISSHTLLACNYLSMLPLKLIPVNKRPPECNLVCYTITGTVKGILIFTSDGIWRHRSGLKLARVNQCWLIIHGVLWHAPLSNFTVTGSVQEFNPQHERENHTSPRASELKNFKKPTTLTRLHETAPR